MSEHSRSTSTVQTIPESLGVWARSTPDAIAILAPGREPITYRELHDAVERLADDLRGLGLGRQDGIALLLPEGPDLYLTLLATMSVGIAIPLVLANPEAEHARALANPRVHAMVVADKEGPALNLGRPELPVITVRSSLSGRIGEVRLSGKVINRPSPKKPPNAEDVALIIHSSGTTGRPKLVARTHENLFSTAACLTEARSFTPADRTFTSAKLAYSQGLTILVATIHAGASLISLPELNLDAMPEWVERFRPTYLSTTPAVLRLLAANRGSPRDALRHASLRCIHSSAGPLSADEIDHLESLLDVRILNGYGMSEATGIAGERYEGFQRARGAVGVPWSDVQIVDTHGQFMRPKEIGEIVVRGPRVFPGYLDDPKANTEAFLPGGWFRTKDLGFLDDSGFLHLTGRLNEMINRGGEKIAPAEVDKALVSHPAVADGAVFAVPDARLGQDMVAAVVFKSDTTASHRELRGWMLDRLSSYKVPRRIWMVDQLPRTQNGKVQRGVLAERFLNETQRSPTGLSE